MLGDQPERTQPVCGCAATPSWYVQAQGRSVGLKENRGFQCCAYKLLGRRSHWSLSALFWGAVQAGQQPAQDGRAQARAQPQYAGRGQLQGVRRRPRDSQVRRWCPRCLSSVSAGELALHSLPPRRRQAGKQGREVVCIRGHSRGSAGQLPIASSCPPDRRVLWPCAACWWPTMVWRRSSSYAPSVAGPTRPLAMSARWRWWPWPPPRTCESTLSTSAWPTRHALCVSTLLHCCACAYGARPRRDQLLLRGAVRGGAGRQQQQQLRKCAAHRPGGGPRKC